jgi:hypothetical protein
MCDVTDCGEAGAAPEAGPDAEVPQGEAGAPPDAGPDAELQGEAGMQSASGGAPSGDSTLEILLQGNGTVAVTGEMACLTSPCSYTTTLDTTFQLQAKPGADSRFVGWSGDCSGTLASTSVAVSGPKQCTASFVVQRAVAAAVSAAGGGSVVSDPDLSCGALGCKGEVDNHSNVTLTATAAAGFKFLGWAGSAECVGITQSSITIEITQDLSCVASFAKQYTLSISAVGAAAQVAVATGNCNAVTCSADAGSSATFQASTVAGFRFTGWTGNALCTGTVNPLVVAKVESDINCIANYAARYTATGLVANGLTGTVSASSANVNATCAGNSCTLDAGTSATLLAPTIAGYRLTGWSGAGCVAGNQSGNGILVTTTNSNITCTANYALGVSVTGTVVGATGSVVAGSASPGATCSAGGCGIDAGGSVTLTAPNLLPGFRFNGWSGDAGCAGATLGITLSNVTTSKACSANYVQQFTIVGAANAGGTAVASKGGVACAANSCTVDKDTSVLLTATPDTANGYHFNAWTGAGCTPAASNPLTLVNVNATCTATFALNTFTISAKAGTNGSVTATRGDTNALCVGDSCTVNFGVNVSLAAAPAANYHFTGWAGAGCTPAGTTPLVLKNLNAACTAAFAINTFTASVTAVPAAGGAVGISCAPGACTAVPYGQSINVSATPNAGWSFGNWSANCAGGSAIVTGNTVCTASFRPIVTGSSPSGIGKVTATGTGNPVCVNGNPSSCTVDSGGSVTLTANPGSNGVFTGWAGDCAGTNPIVTLANVTAPKNCTAGFYQLWAQSSGAGNVDSMTHVVTLGDGTVVGIGTSLPVGSKVNGLALVDLDANTGKLTRNQRIIDADGAGELTSLGLTTATDQKSIVALALHTSKTGKLPFLHSETKAGAFDLDYKYSGAGAASPLGGEVSPSLDGGYAFCVGITDPPNPNGAQGPMMAHLTKVDAAGKVNFDVEFCGTDPNKQNCLPTLPVDLLQEPATKDYVVLSQVAVGTTNTILLTFISNTGAVLGSSYYQDGVSLSATQLVRGATADTYLVVGTRLDAKRSINGFYAELSRAGAAPRFGYTAGTDGTIEQLFAVAKIPGGGYGLAGGFTTTDKGAEAWLLLIDDNGNVKSQVAFGGPVGDRLLGISNVPAGGFALGGVTTSWGANQSMWTLRVDPNANIGFNAGLVPPAVRYATAFGTVSIKDVLTAPKVTPQVVASDAAPVAAAVKLGAAGFTQVQQTP